MILCGTIMVPMFNLTEYNEGGLFCMDKFINFMCLYNYKCVTNTSVIIHYNNKLNSISSLWMLSNQENYGTESFFINAESLRYFYYKKT